MFYTFMMSIIKTIKLSPAFIEKIKEICPVKKFSLTSPLFYEGQTPVVAYLVVEGSVVLFKKKKVKNVVKPGSLIGLKELVTNSPSRMTAEVSAESTLCFLDKSTMLEVMNLENSELPNLFIKIEKKKEQRDS